MKPWIIVALDILVFIAAIFYANDLLNHYQDSNVSMARWQELRQEFHDFQKEVRDRFKRTPEIQDLEQ